MTHRQFVLFDFDGVIADSFPLASALAKRVCKHNTEEFYRSAFEGNIYDTYDKNKPGAAQPDHGDECEHDIDWWPEYQKAFEGASEFDGVVPAIQKISESRQLAIISSCGESLIRPFLERCGIEGCFSDILDLNVHTHKAKKIEMIFKKYGVSGDDCVFITDTLGDIREAAVHNVGAIGCAWGFHGSDRLERGNPFRILHTPTELPQAVNDYFAR